jgi:hypothetical protein
MTAATEHLAPARPARPAPPVGVALPAPAGAAARRGPEAYR